MTNLTNSTYPTTFNLNRAAVEIAALLILDQTAECRLSEVAQFEGFQRRLEAQRAAAQARFAKPKSSDVQRAARVLGAWARS